MFKSIIDLHTSISKVNKPIFKELKERKVHMVKQNFNYLIETSRDDYKHLIKITDNIKNEYRIHINKKDADRTKETRSEDGTSIID